MKLNELCEKVAFNSHKIGDIVEYMPGKPGYGRMTGRHYTVLKKFSDYYFSVHPGNYLATNFRRAQK